MLVKGKGVWLFLTAALLCAVMDVAGAAPACGVGMGDNSNVALWAALLMIAGCGLVLFLLWRRHKKNK